MKKFYALALGALVLTAGCSKDDPEPVLPDLMVNEVSLNPTTSQIEAPEVTNVEVKENLSDLILTFANGQQIDVTPGTTAANLYLVTNVRGIENVIVPGKVTIEGKEYTIGGWDLSPYEGVGKDVKTITISNTAKYSMQGSTTLGFTLKPINNEFFTDLSVQGENLTGVFLEEDFGTYSSDNGVIYSTSNSGVVTLVMVPRQYNSATRVFTVPVGVSVIGTRAFAKCKDLERIIISSDVTSIEDEAFSNTDNLIALDMCPEVAPKAAEHAFGHWTRKATLRIPNGSRASYLLQNPFAEIDPDRAHPAPGTAYITYMGLDAKTFNAANTADWTEADWTANVPEPKAPAADASAPDVLRYQNARAAYAKYLGALDQYNHDNTIWAQAAEKWNEKDAKKIIAEAEPRYPDAKIERPTRPANLQNPTVEEQEKFNKDLEDYYEQNYLYNREQGAIEQFKVDLPAWENAKVFWESTRGYQFFKKVKEVDFLYN